MSLWVGRRTSKRIPGLALGAVEGVIRTMDTKTRLQRGSEEGLIKAKDYRKHGAEEAGQKKGFTAASQKGVGRHKWRYTARIS